MPSSAQTSVHFCIKPLFSFNSFFKNAESSSSATPSGAPFSSMTRPTSWLLSTPSKRICTCLRTTSATIAAVQVGTALIIDFLGINSYLTYYGKNCPGCLQKEDRDNIADMAVEFESFKTQLRSPLQVLQGIWSPIKTQDGQNKTAKFDTSNGSNMISKAIDSRQTEINS